MSSVVQTRVFANQLSATVWPYLSFSVYEGDTTFRYTLDNDGLGPAILRSATLELDGKRYGSFRSFGYALMGGSAPHKSVLRSSSLSSGQVIRPGISSQVLGYEGPRGREYADAARKRAKVTVCYCSLLEQCWTLTSLEASRGPAQVAHCPADASIDAG